LTFNKDLNQNTNYQLGKIDVGNTKLSQKEGPRLGLKWLITQSDKTVASYVDGIFEKLAEEDLLPKEFSPPKKDDVPELIDRIYYTNWFKYATLNEKKLSNWLESDGERSMDQVSDSEISGLLNNKYNKNKKIQNSLLKQEIQAVDPDLVLVLGSLPWTGFFYNDVEPYSDGSLTDSYPVKKTTYKVHGRPYRYSDSSGTSAKVIPFYHASSTGYAQNAPQYLDNPLRDTKRRLSEALKA
jgi:hypothetical protein